MISDAARWGLLRRSRAGSAPGMKRRSALTSIGALVVLGLTPACARFELPYPLSAVEAAPAPIHPLRIAILPFTDARAPEEVAAGADGFEYRGVELDHTPLERLDAPFEQLTEVVARHLAAARTFRQVILVRSLEQAPEADLVLEGRVRRASGYVESRPPPKATGRPADERVVLAEVLLSELRVRAVERPDRVLFRMDAGWSIYEPRRSPDGPPDPWSILGEALFAAIGDLEHELSRADLSGRVVLAERVELAETATSSAAAWPPPPAGWRVARTSTSSSPHGWRSAAAECALFELEELQRKRFHRVLGPYHAAVRLWSCPPELALSYDARVELPARYLGDGAGGQRYFLGAVGESSWPTAERDLRRFLGITPPANRHTFELRGAGPRRADEPVEEGGERP